MAATPEILSKLNIGSGMNNSEIIAALVNAEKAPALDRIERSEEQTENKISAYSLLKNEIREKILHRCEILRYMGDDGISCIYDQLPDHELVDDCGWVLDHDDLDNFQLGITRKN